MSLKSKNAIITGASRAKGIGAAVARAFARAGANVLLTTYAPYDATMPWGSDENEVERLVEELRRYGVQASSLELDLSRKDAAPVLFD